MDGFFLTKRPVDGRADVIAIGLHIGDYGQRDRACFQGWHAYLGALYRGRGRAERQIADLKDTGLTNLPSHSFAINQAWTELCLIAQDLFAWTRLLGLEPQPSPGDDLTRAEPKRLRYCLLHTAGTVVTTGRRHYCRLADTWPWTRQLIGAFERIHRLPQLC